MNVVLALLAFVGILLAIGICIVIALYLVCNLDN